MADYTQKGRFFKVVCEGMGADDLFMRSFAGVESLSEPYSFRVRFSSMIGPLAPEKLLGKHMTVELEAPGGVRHFDGIVRRFGPLGQTSEIEVLEAEIVPQFWLRSLSWNCRIFQELSTPEIVEKVLKEGNVKFKAQLTASYSKRVYCTQYNETDFTFVSRLLEEEGIHYFFEHKSGEHTLILSDKSSSAKPCTPQKEFRVQQVSKGLKDDVFHALQIQTSIHPGLVMIRDYDFENPDTRLEASSKTVSKLPDLDSYEVYEYPGHYTRPKDGKTRADLLMERQEVSELTVNGASNGRSIQAGQYFSLAEHHAADDYLLVEVRHEGQNPIDEGEPSAYSNSFRAIPKSVAFRPLRRTPRPVVPGVQTAKVVGKSGEEIYTDQYGRIKVKFPWIRDDAEDEKSSCWIRVSTQAAGPQWGSVFVPRIGWEVLVTFLDGDPDRPLVTGAVYNGKNKPPYELPANQTQSGVKTRSSKKGDAKTFNELRFEDLLDKEEIYIHAERDLNIHVENNESRAVAGNRTTSIEGPGKEKAAKFSDVLTIKKGGQSLEIAEGDQDTLLKSGNQTIKLDKGDQTIELGNGNQKIDLKNGDRTIKLATGANTIEAMKSITLKVGSNSIEISQQGITVKGIQIKVEGQATADLKSPMTTVNGDGMLTLKGALTKIN